MVNVRLLNIKKKLIDLNMVNLIVQMQVNVVLIWMCWFVEMIERCILKVALLVLMDIIKIVK